MSAKELLGLCKGCGQMHPVNGPCPGEGLHTAPRPPVVLVPDAAGCTTVRDAGSTHVVTIPAVESVRRWVEQCHLTEQERDVARAALADAERLRRGLVSRLRDLASRIGPARRAEDIRAALEEVLHGADCRDLPRDTALDEARAGRDVLARELSRAQGDVADLSRQRDEALALLRRWQEWFRGGVAVPPRQTENSGDIARAAALLLRAAPAPGKEADRDVPVV